MGTLCQKWIHFELQGLNNICNKNLKCNRFILCGPWSPQIGKSLGMCDIAFNFNPLEVRIMFEKRGKIRCGFASRDPSSPETARNKPKQIWGRNILSQATNIGLGLALIVAAITVFVCGKIPRAVNWFRISQFKSAINGTEFNKIKQLEPQSGASSPVVNGVEVLETKRVQPSVFFVHGGNDSQEPTYCMLYAGDSSTMHSSTQAMPVYFVGTRKKRVSKFVRKNQNLSNESVQLQSKMNEGKDEINGAQGHDKDNANSWLNKLKEEALRRGVKKEVIERAFDGVILSERILEIAQNCPEVKLTAEEYLKRMVTDQRVSRGVTAFREHQELLEEISLKYGVPAPLLVAVWGIESSYGAFTGGWDTIQALLTMSFGRQEEPGRSKYFREEIFSALSIIEQGHGPPGNKRLEGSYAGAMGQCQFMPSSFLFYAVDYDGDGRTDIWESHADIFASMANYLQKHGWKEGCPIAQKVYLDKDIDQSLLGLNVKKSVTEWKNDYKVMAMEGEPEAPLDEMASLIAPDGPQADAYLVYDNFRTIMRYNTSVLYSISVYDLTHKIHRGLLEEQ